MDKQELIIQLTKLTESKNIITNDKDQQRFIRDWRGRYNNPCLAIVTPETTQQVISIVKFCYINNLKFIPQGGNTSLCGSSVPTTDYNQIIINLTKLSKIKHIDTQNNSIEVEAGCTLLDINTLAKQHQLFLPIKIASEGLCQIGGAIATNAGGINVLKYGSTREQVLGLEVVLPNGELVNQTSSVRKNNLNFDLKQLFIGSEGTLGIITSACLKLHPLPNEYFTGIIGVTSLDGAIAIMNSLKKLNLCAYEIISHETKLLHDKHFNSIIATNSQWVIIFELEIDNLDINLIYEYLSQMQAIIIDSEIATNLSSRQKIWNFREQIPLAEKAHGLAIKHDICLPINQIEAFIQQNQAKIHQAYPNQTSSIIFGHLGDGNLHYNISFNQHLKSIPSEIELAINELVYEDVYKHNGSFSAEHGIGQLKQQWFKKYYDRNSYKLAKQIKTLIDDKQIANIGKVFDLDLN